MQAKARMQDVAKLAGVGLMTVSRALNKSGPVSEETRRRVHDAIATLNYRPKRPPVPCATDDPDRSASLCQISMTPFLQPARMQLRSLLTNTAIPSS